MVTCTTCRGTIPETEINMVQGVAFCRACNKLWKVSDLAVDAALLGTMEAGADFNAPPAGCAHRDDGVTQEAVAPMRSLGAGLSLLFFAVLWNSILAVIFVVGWIGRGNATATSDSPMTEVDTSGGTAAGGEAIPVLFLTPFLLVGIGVALGAAVMLLGRTTLSRRGDEAWARSGLGPIAWTQRFKASAVRSIQLGLTTWQQNGRSLPVVVIEADRTVRLGAQLKNERRAWLMAAAQRMFPEAARQGRG